MSAHFLSIALRINPTKPIDKLILIYLANHCSDGSVVVNIEELQTFCGRSQKACERSLHRLRDDGHIFFKKDRINDRVFSVEVFEA